MSLNYWGNEFRKHISMLESIRDKWQERNQRMDVEDWDRAQGHLEKAREADGILASLDAFRASPRWIAELAEDILRFKPIRVEEIESGINPDLPSEKWLWLREHGMGRVKGASVRMTKGHDFKPEPETRLARLAVNYSLRELKTALHESGHALLADGFGSDVEVMEFAPDSSTAARILYHESRDLESYKKVAVSVAGKAAEIQGVAFYPALRELAADEHSSQSDYKKASEIALQIWAEEGKEAADQVKTQAWEEAANTVRENFGTIIDLAERFLLDSHLDADEIRAVIGQREAPYRLGGDAEDDGQALWMDEDTEEAE